MTKNQTYPVPHETKAIQQADERLGPARDLVEYFGQYAREKPTVVALWCLGIGFVLGWKLKPW